MNSNLLHAIILGALQGATEFLPVSSSGHLVIAPWLLGWKQPSLIFDIVVHWGTLLALIIFFRKDLWKLFCAGLKSIRNLRIENDDERLAWAIAIGSVPAAIIGLALEKYFEELFAAPLTAAVFLLVTAIILTLSERMSRKQRKITSINFYDALIIGAAQACAILPGISRSGSTIAAGLARNLNRETAAKFSFLLGAPVIFGAGLVKLPHLFTNPDIAHTLPLMAGGFISSFIVGYIAIKILMNYVKTRGLYPFAIYCAILGIVTIATSYI